MTWRTPTYRLVDGERIAGAWCHVWIRSMRGFEYHYYLDDLFAYADGVIKCWETFDLAELRRRLETGKIALHNPADPEPPQVEQTPRWSARYPEPLTNESFLDELADEIRAMNGRPTTSDLCREAMRQYQHEPTEENRLLVREAYLAIPAHRRVYVLGDMDVQDIPLRYLITDIGEPVGGDGPIATSKTYEEFLDYLNGKDRDSARGHQRMSAMHADDPKDITASTVTVPQRVNSPAEPAAQLDLGVLHNGFPASISYRGHTYPTILHGYWAIAVADGTDHDRIRDAETAHDAHEIGGSCALRADWPVVRLAVMAGLLRAKFAQHPELAAVLLSTADARISYTGLFESSYWTTHGFDEGRNWVGRLLELIRAELAVDN
ncbi:NADAR family protein [Nocardia sp. NPDC049149]|uniref:NADAR family protein n=1 Tax=Nocardia sp. NPDC049149 TaxID=3364315 RepID=UPI00371F9C02